MIWRFGCAQRWLGGLVEKKALIFWWGFCLQNVKERIQFSSGRCGKDEGTTLTLALSLWQRVARLRRGDGVAMVVIIRIG